MYDMVKTLNSVPRVILRPCDSPVPFDDEDLDNASTTGERKFSLYNTIFV
jgi:hypothetical protein